MNAKFPILIAAGLFLVTASKAQYAPSCADPRVVIQGRVVISGRAVIAYDYNNPAYDNNNYVPRGRYDARRDWRADEYERYCRDHREYRGDRGVFYRDRPNYRIAPYYYPGKVACR
jgi:hypothetical protein